MVGHAGSYRASRSASRWRAAMPSARCCHRHVVSQRDRLVSESACDDDGLTRTYGLPDAMQDAARL